MLFEVVAIAAPSSIRPRTVARCIEIIRPALSSRTDRRLALLALVSAKKIDGVPVFDTGATNLLITVPTLTRISAAFSRVYFCHVSENFSAVDFFQKYSAKGSFTSAVDP